MPVGTDATVTTSVDRIAFMDIPLGVERSLHDHPAVRSIKLIGSRARGDSTPFSDWDFEIATNDFPSLADAMPSMLGRFRPLAQQWDRLSVHKCYMLVLEGPEKVDFLFDEPHTAEPPWTVNKQTLQAIDDHFWDWILWLLSKEAADREEIVSVELGKMFDHLLQPMGVSESPIDLSAAVNTYVAARRTQERRHSVLVTKTLEEEVRKALTKWASALHLRKP